jgi:hypothetical protein
MPEPRSCFCVNSETPCGQDYTRRRLEPLGSVCRSVYGQVAAAAACLGLFDRRCGLDRSDVDLP